MIRKEAWSFYRTSSGVRLCWELEEPKGPKGPIPYSGISLIGKGIPLGPYRRPLPRVLGFLRSRPGCVRGGVTLRYGIMRFAS